MPVHCFKLTTKLNTGYALRVGELISFHRVLVLCFHYNPWPFLIIRNFVRWVGKNHIQKQTKFDTVKKWNFETEMLLQQVCNGLEMFDSLNLAKY